MSLSRRTRVGLVATVVTTAVAVLAGAGLGDTLVYYRTPSEALAAPVTADRLRVGGLVVDGSLRRSGSLVRFTITDGVRDLAVEHRGTAPGVLQEGQGAVVEGQLSPTGVLAADSVLVKHSNEYSRQ